MNNEEPENSKGRWPLAAALSKAAVIACCGWIAWHGLLSLRALLATERGGAIAIQQALDGSPLERAPWLSRQSEGHWSFAGWQWRIGVREVGGDRLSEVMAEQVSRELAVPGPAEAGERRFLDALRQLGGKVSADATGETLSSTDNDLRWQVRVAQRDGESRLASGVLAMRVDARTWHVWELLRADRESEQLSRGKLLPYGEDATQLASRSTNSGELMFELVGLSGSATASDLIRGWRSAGWQASPLQAAPFGATVGSGAPGFHYLCIRGRDRVVVWSTGGGHRPTSLIAARLAESDNVSTPIAKASTR